MAGHYNDQPRLATPDPPMLPPTTAHVVLMVWEG